MSDSFPETRRTSVSMRVVGTMERGQSSGSSYDSLDGAPIQNIRGVTHDNYVMVRGLEAGHYSLSGYYKLDSDKLLSAEVPIELTVYDGSYEEDGDLEDIRVVEYRGIEDMKIYLYKFVFRNGILVEKTKSSLEGPEWGSMSGD